MTALLLTLASFLLILILSRLRAPLAVAILGGALALGLAFGLTPGETLVACGNGIVQPLALAVILAVVLILAISEVMHISGALDTIVQEAGAWLRRPSVTAAALPALIGLLPMPGGALFSAPMVEAAAIETGAGRDLLSAVNYWFRHIWEHWWPLYPGVILAVTLTASSVGEFAFFQLPVGIVMAAAGLLLLRQMPPVATVRSAPRPHSLRRLARAASPIGVVLAVWLAATATASLAGVPFPRGATGEALRGYLPITLGLLASLAWAARSAGIGLARLGSILSRPAVGPLVAVVVTVMAYQNVLAVTDAGSRIAAEMAAHDLPVLLVVAGLPAIAGLVTGIAFGFVGVSFPIVLGLLGALPAAASPWPYTVLAYACGHLGMMLSPIHVCYVVSNRYFGTEFVPVYRRLAGPALVTAASVLGYFLLLRAVLG